MPYTNTELLNAHKSTLLSGVDKQRRFLLKIATTPTTCAGCGQLVSQVEATGKSLDEYPVDDAQDSEFTCPHCQTKLHWIVPLMGAPFWMTERAYQGTQERK